MQETPQASLGQTNEPHERKKLLAVGLISLVIVALAVGAIIMVATMGSKTTPPAANQVSTEETLFYDALGNGAKQQQLRVAMYRATYANKADADAAKNIGTELSSVAEVDTAAGKMRSVFATNNTDAPNFNMGRCMDGTTYIDTFNTHSNLPPTSLAPAAEMLKTNQNIAKATEAIVFTPCPQLGLMPSAVPDLAQFRFSDGVFPVTLNDSQAENWKNKVKEAKLFTFKDEGMVEHDGKQLRKVSFTPKDETTVNDTLNSIFMETAEISKIKAENPKALVDYEFISVGPRNTGSVGGFYLIDEAKKLPVYSELYSTNPDRQLGEGAAASNIARTKQTYQFGMPLALTLEAPLEITK